jgi:hypothetical protein
MGMLCRLAYEKDGFAGLKRIMQYKSLDEVFTNEFKRKDGERDKFIRNVIEKG